MYDKLLLIPGPTNLSRRVREAMARPQLPHVGKEFYSSFKEILDLGRHVFRNEKGFQFVFTGTGTTGMEASVLSLIQRGDRTLTLSTGYFGHRMLMLNQIHGARADVIDYPDGHPADPDDLRKRLKKAKYAAVFVTHVDTSTSVLNPVKDLVEECSKAGVRSVVDGVCSVGGVPLDFDRLGADIVFTASQKALGAAPGAVLIATTEEALDYMAKRRKPIEAYYMNLLRWKPVMDDPRMYLATPATQVLLALREALKEVLEEGLEARWTRHRKLGGMTRERVSDWGFKFVAEEGHRADTVTSFWVKDGTAGDIQKTLENEYDIVVARGISEAKDKMIRIGHFGNLAPETLGEALDAFGKVASEVGALATPTVVRRRKR
jgi:alanine-glyoxylate transaminase / serine-glyoxylate transaminase / serine-pyruvate transaminase